MQPQTVNPNNFLVRSVVYDDGDFSMAWGTWHETQEDRLAMRWNGTGNSDPGYPKLFGHPVWFILPGTLTVPVLKAILGENGFKKAELLRTLDLKLA